MILAAPLFIKKGGIMQPVTDRPVLEIHPTDHSNLSAMHGRFSLGSYASPSSPKTQELRARYEALHTEERDFKSLKSVSHLQRVK
jgi:hypothetical protein